jgi:hypothetical protein
LFSCATAAIGATASAIAAVSAVNFSGFLRKVMRSSMSDLWRLAMRPDLPDAGSVSD